MKKQFLKFAWILIFGVLISSCDQNNKLKNDNSLNYKEAKEKLQCVVMDLASNRQWLAQALVEKVDQGGVSLSKIADVTPNTILVNGVQYDVKIGLLNNNQGVALNKLAKTTDNSTYAVMLDPDRFYPEESQLEAQVWNGESVEMQIITIPPVLDEDNELDEDAYDRKERERDSIIASLGYPVFTVDIEEADEDLQLSTEVTADDWYLRAYQIRLLHGHDGGDEEVEIFTETNIPLLGRAFKRNTTLKFNGNNHSDLSGQVIKFPDINHCNRDYTMSNIAIGEGTFASIIIDDDNNAGKHRNSVNTGISNTYGTTCVGTWIDVPEPISIYKYFDISVTPWYEEDDDVCRHSFLTGGIAPYSGWRYDTPHAQYWLKTTANH